MLELTLWSFEMNNGIVVFEHVHFFNITEWLHAYTPIQVTTDWMAATNLPNFLIAALSFLSSPEAAWLWVCTTFFVLL